MLALVEPNPTFRCIKIQENNIKLMKYVNFSWILSILWYTDIAYQKWEETQK